ncbi:MAG: hypothetical protein KC503_18285 [Myxococcales bacterium]|nr:hypothetical protein [Myxococcales bacterium]
MKLEQHRIKAEAEAKALEKKVPWVPIGIAIGVLVCTAGALGYYSYVKNKEKDAAAKALAAQRAKLESFRKEMAQQQARFQAEQEALESAKKKLLAKLSVAKDEAQRELIRKQMRNQAQRAHALAERKRKARAAAKRRAKRLRIRNTSDPLGGLKL